ncbi:hypothetical protein HDU96_001073 [Phlyctochytrium bullatum]|nr:hypothetical protein HDU96_001073 [Phlyctochytrium bullatum]
MSSIPTTQKGLVVQSDQSLKVESIPLPAFETEHDILVKVHYVAQNPTDWKHVDFKLATAGKIVGCDFSGEVVKVGSLATSVKVGQKVAGFVHGGLEPHHGAYSQYVRLRHDLVIPVPDAVPLDSAATIPLAAATASLCLFQSLELPAPFTADPTSLAVPVPFDPTLVLVWGAASSVGLFAVQLAKAAGFRVLAIASPKNWDLVRAHGADHFLDYRDADVVAKIKAVAAKYPRGLRHVVDTISEGGTTETILKAVDSGAKIGVILPQPPAVNEIRKDVAIVLQLVYTIFGRHVKTFGLDIPPKPQDLDLASKTYLWISRLLGKGLLRGNPVALRAGGLDGVVEGFDYMRKGNVSAQKLVYRIADTQGL